jgi:hypothetical protein
MIRQACRMPEGLGPLPPIQTLFALVLLLLMDLHVGEFAMGSFRRILERFTRDTEAAAATSQARGAAPSVARRAVSAGQPPARRAPSRRRATPAAASSDQDTLAALPAEPAGLAPTPQRLRTVSPVCWWPPGPDRRRGRAGAAWHGAPAPAASLKRPHTPTQAAQTHA